MTSSRLIDRRAFLQGMGGMALALPVLDAMGAGGDRTDPPPLLRPRTRPTACRFPAPQHGIDEWSWFPDF